MGKPIYWIYRIFFVPVFIVGAFVCQAFNKKLRARIKIENEFRKNRLKNSEKTDNKKRVLFHCSSLGEWEQAAPLAEIIKKNNPGITIMVSFFSISGFNHLKNVSYVDEKVFLPFDVYKRAKSFFKVMKPDLWIISAYDVWPNHVMAARNCNVPMVVISATLASTSKRHKGLQRALNKYIYKNIQVIYSRSANDSKRFLNIYPYPGKIKTYGDTRADRVYEKSISIKQGDGIRVFSNKSDTDIVFIAGSSWPGDERVIIPGLIRLLEKYDHFKVIMVPHEIKNEHINEIQKAFGDKGFGSERYSVFKEGNGTEKRIAIIDTIGLLARLYRDTHIAYVGGSFGKGVHNVLEPAVFGMPVLFGPKHHNSQEALSMKEMGITFETRDTREFTGMMEKLVNDRGFRDNCAGEALGYIRNNLGASGKIYQNLSNIFDFF